MTACIASYFSMSHIVYIDRASPENYSCEIIGSSYENLENEMFLSIRFLYLPSSSHTPHTCTHSCLRRNTLTADNLYIADITSTGESRVSFSLYARLDGGTISGSALATAVLVRVSAIKCYCMHKLCNSSISLCGCICHNLSPGSP